MKKQFRIATFGLIAAAALMLGLRSTVAQTAKTYIPGHWLTVVKDCSATSSDCHYDPYSQSWQGSKTFFTGNLQYCVQYADGDGCTELGCTGTTTTGSCP